MKKIMLSFAGVMLFSSQAWADNCRKYVLIQPDGTQVSADAPPQDISYPPSDASGRSRLHLIIVEPEGGAPEPMILTNKNAAPAVKAPAETAADVAVTKAEAVNHHVAVQPQRRTAVFFGAAMR